MGTHRIFNAGALDGLHEELEPEIAAAYPDEESRTLVNTLLIPEFKAALEKVLRLFCEERALTTVAISRAEVQALCADVDQIFITKAELLDTENLFKPFIEMIVPLRERIKEELLQDFYNDCRSTLAQKGVTNTESLISKGTNWFHDTNHAPYGKGISFARKILGEKVPNVNKEVLARIAAKLFPEEEKVTKMDAAYFEDIQNIDHDLKIFAQACKVDIAQLTSGKAIRSMTVMCSNNEKITGITYLSRAAICLGLTSEDSRPQNKVTEALLLLKKKLGIETISYPTMDTAYFTDTNHIRHDLTAYAHTKGVSIEGITPHNCMSIEVVCSNGETVKGGTYWARAGVALGIARTLVEGQTKRGQTIMALKKKLSIEVKQYQKMDAVYFGNAANIEADLTAYAQALNLPVDELYKKSMLPISVVCNNGETLRGHAYLYRAQRVFGITSQEKTDCQLEALIALKKIIGIEVESVLKMDHLYFAQPENILHDLRLYAQHRNNDIQKLTANYMLGVETTCANKESVNGVTYLQRAAVALGTEPRQRAHVLALLKEKIAHLI